MSRRILVALIPLVSLLPAVSFAQAKHFSLETTQQVRLHNVTAEPATLAGKKGLRVVAAPGASEQADLFASLEGVTFSNGTIEVEVAGSPTPGAFTGARGFVGIAFRVQPDDKTYDAFYLRPTNGRAEDQERRNHSAQYVSQPDWPWSRLRNESPSKYEAYVDLEPGVWTTMRIEVHGDHAALYVHNRAQPTLIVNDVKSGADAAGGVALWLGPGTTAYFRNVTVR